MSLEFRNSFPQPLRRKRLDMTIEGHDFAVTIHRRGARRFAFLVEAMPRRHNRPLDDLVANTFVENDARFILFSPQLMPESWREAESFVADWARGVVNYLERGVRFYLSRASDEFATAPGDKD